MRNLKRALSLALASVMLMGMMVVGTSAASYPDVDDQDHVEAIEVLSAVGVIVGDNGNFRPDDSVSRNEMAVIMAKLILGTYEADSYVGNHPFTDVPDWASKYVAACYNSGIIAGRTETTYDGTATVTAVEAAAMMLRALGYEDLSKGAAQWDQPVAAKANEINLFVGLNGAGNAAMNRDSVAQLALNTIQATMVTTVRTGQDITLPDGTVISGTRSYNLRTTNYGWQDAIDDEGTDNGYGYLQLGEYLYKGDLKRETNKTDDFGRPATKWLYNSSEIIAAVEEADATYTKEVKVKDIYKDLGLGETKTATRITDGVEAEEKVSLTRISDTKLGGNGVLIQAFKNKDGKVSIVEINTYLVRATADYSTKDEKLSVMAYGVKLANSKIANEDVAVSEFEKDDLILVTGVMGDKGLEIKTAELAVLEEDVKVSAYNGEKDYVTAGGTKYSYNKNASYNPDSAIDNYNLQKTSYTLVLDKYDYVIGVKKFSDEVTLDDMLFVKDAAKSGFNWEAKAVFMDGSEKRIVIAGTKKVGGSDYTAITVDTAADGTALDADGKMSKNRFYQFSEKSNGEYELLDLADTSRQGKVDASGNDNTKDIVGGEVQPIRTLTKPANDNTVFIAKDTLYTGIKEAPDVANSAVYYLLDKDSKYILAAYTAKAGVSVSNTSEYVYILEEKGEGKDDDGKSYNIYTAIVDGEKVEYNAKGDDKDPGLYEIRTTEDGYPKLGDAIAASVADQMYVATGVGKSSISYKSGVVNAGKGLKVNEDTVVYVVDVADKSVNVIDASAVDGIDAGTYSVYAIFVSKSDSNVKTLWLAKTSANDTMTGGSASDIENALSEGPVTVTGEVSGNPNVEDGQELTLGTDSSLAEGATVTVANGATVKVDANVTGEGEIKLEGGTLEVGKGVTKLPNINAESTGTITVADKDTKVQLQREDENSDKFGLEALAELVENKETGSGTTTDKKTVYTYDMDAAALTFAGPGYFESYSGTLTLDTLVGYFTGSKNVGFVSIQLPTLAKGANVKVAYTLKSGTVSNDIKTSGIFGASAEGYNVTADDGLSDVNVVLPYGDSVTSITITVDTTGVSSGG